MNDDTLSAVRDHLRQVSDSLGEVHLSIPAGEIAARASRRRRHRWLAATGAACAALALTLGLALPSGNPARPARPVHVHLAAWSVDSNRDGTVTLTVRDLTHVALLARVLGEAGVPAIIALHAQCLSTQNQNALDRSGALRSGRAGVVIHPAAIPAGTRILIGLLTADQVRVWSPSTGWQRAGHGHQVVGFGWGLVRSGEPLHCISTHHNARFYYTR